MGTIKTTNIETITGSGTLTLGQSGETVSVAGKMSGQNYPAFQAYLSADQTVTNEVSTKLQANNESFDTDGYYDNVTNYRFTPLVAGKYIVYTSFSFDSTTNDTNIQQKVLLHKNGSAVNQVWQILTSNERLVNLSPSYVIGMNGTTDYLEMYGFTSFSGGSTPKFYRDTWWGAYRIGD